MLAYGLFLVKANNLIIISFMSTMHFLNIVTTRKNRVQLPQYLSERGNRLHGHGDD
jgi:hypothetical protein